jgi:PAS domain S-box-containing protein
VKSQRFKHQTLALFFIVSAIPALVVGAVWYVYIESSSVNFLLLDYQSFVLPVIMVGLLPAVILSYIFAELLSRPVRNILENVTRLAAGDFGRHFETSGRGEFAEIGDAINKVSAKLQETLSEASAETGLIAAERGKLHSVLNSMTDGVFALDRSGRIILFNKAACEITGRTIGEVAGQLAEKVMPFRSGGELVMTRWLAEGAGAEHKIGQWKGLELYASGGHSLFVDVQAVTLKDDPNGIAALITFHDLTSAHQLEEMKIDFVALAAHELRTPLTEIKGYLDILSTEGKSLTKSQRGFLNAAISSAGQLGDLMHNLLNVARIEHGEVSHHPMPLDYRQFILDSVASLKNRTDLMQRSIEVKAPAGKLVITADASALQEVIANLISNAIAHTASDGGKIIVELRVHRTNIETIVSDNGVGIPASAIPHLFTKFFRVDEMRSSYRGTGLGLFICRSIIEAHGGHISVKSTEGQGTSLTFILPRPAVAPVSTKADNKLTTRGAHGWIKDNTVR